MRRIPDKYIAIGLFLLVLGLYLWRKDELLKQMAFGLFSLVCMAIGDGLRRVTDSFKARMGNEKTNIKVK